MMTRRRRNSLLGLAFLALLLIIIWILYLLFGGSSATDRDLTQSSQQETDKVEEVIPDRPTVSEQEKEDARDERNTSSDVISLSKTFVERYGSYSNEADFGNLEDVMSLMTDEFEAQTAAFIAKSEAPETYYGVSTKVITVEVEEQNETMATVLVNTQREEATGSPQNTSVKYQQIELEFVKESGVWKIDSATWL